MPAKKKMTQREKAERARIKKEPQKEGLLPPDKPKLNLGRLDKLWNV